MIKLSRWMNAAALLALAAVLVPGPARASDGIVALTPRPNEHVSQSPKVVTVEVPGRSKLERSAVRMVVDGRDVSDTISTTRDLVQYKPAQPLAAGEHAVEVAVTDAAGGRLSYSWTFTVDGSATQSARRAPAPSSADAAAAPQASPSVTDSNDATAPASDASGYGGATPQTVLGQQNFYGGFYPIGGAPYYWGDNAQFEFMGIPGGYGFLTFSGIPGVFDLLPLGLNTFYAVVPIPIGFIFGPPFVTCHFFTPGGGSTVVVLPSFPVVHHRRIVVTEPVSRTPVVGRSLAFPSSHGASAPGRLMPIERTAPSVRTMPHAPAMHVTRPVVIRPLTPHPILRFAAVSRPPTVLAAPPTTTRVR